MPPFVKNQILNVAIHGLGSSGEGVGSVDGYVIFVEGALPGEQVQARLTSCHTRHAFADLVSIESLSPDRVPPPCPVFGHCGGCQIMHLRYPKQLEMKREKVANALQRIGKIDCPVADCIPSPSPLGYRNKIQLPMKKVDGRLAFGLYARSSHDLVEVDACLIHCSLGEKIFESVRTILNRWNIPFRHLLIKSALKTNQALVIIVSDSLPEDETKKLAREIQACHPAIQGVIHNLHNGPENVILGKKYTLLAGRDFVEEVLSGLTFRISPAAFFQVNPGQAEQLYAKAVELANLKGNETVLDAYCGVGTLALHFAKHVKKVVGVECVAQAIEDARENAKINRIQNASFLHASSEDFIGSSPYFDLILLNPPRKGCDPKFLQGIERIAPPQLLYISCDPATLARDLSFLQNTGYEVKIAQPFDMFPQTSHVECLAHLVKT